jgi:hypothetical protein
MLINRHSYKYAIRILAVTLSIVFCLSGSVVLPQSSVGFQSDDSACSNLAVMSANERDMPHEMRATAYRELFQDKLAPIYGGKNAWDKVLEDLSGKIGFSIPGSARFQIKDIWSKFIDANQTLVKEGNDYIEKDLKAQGKVTAETIEKLSEISSRFTFPKELELFIRAHTDDLRGWVIARSSGRNEDSYLRNLAGIFISPRRKDERLVVQGVKEIFKHAIERIWITENKSESKTEGIPNTLTADEGFGILIQPFLQFDASGTAMTNLYGYASIEAVVGDADMAVRGIHANTSQFLFRKSDPSKFEYNPSFLTIPYQCRVKGTEYCVENNSEEMRTLIDSYPKINGKFSPVNEAQARELYRVIAALEDEIGVPLDVEWGFREGKLYIIQIRPIIGDFRKPLVGVSAELQTKQKIAQTPIALGHTAPNGFTGRMVVVGNNVPRGIIQQFEDEFGSEYIRVQSDIASSVLGSKTKAKVLVDPEQGSRQAHNINLVTSRISAGEFAYCNGPILKNDLLQSLDFVPHPKFQGVWVSDQEVTYFADGLKGVFYKSDTKTETLKQGDNYNRQAALINFHDKVRDSWLKDDIGMPEHAWILETMQIFRYGAHFGRSIEEMFIDMRHEENCNLDFVQRKLLALDYNESDFGMIQYELGLLDEALSFPLYPSHWESLRIRGFKNILFLKGISEKLKEEAQPRQETIIPQKYVVLLLDPYNLKKPAKTQLEKSVEGAQVIRVSSEELLNQGGEKLKILPDQLPAIKTADTISAIYIRLNTYYDFASLFTVLTKIRRENPDALIIIDGNTLYGDEFKRFTKKYGQVILKTGGVFEDHEIIKLIQEDHFKWTERRRAAQDQQATVQAGAPTKPEKLAVLWIEPEDREIKGVEGRIAQNFSGNNEYEFVYAKTMKEAVTKMQERKFDIAAFDLLVWHDEDYMLKYSDGLKNIPNLYAVTLEGEHVSLMELHAMFEEDANRVEIIHKPQDIGMERFGVKYDQYSYVNKLILVFKSLRQQQIDAYEQALAAWELTQPKEPIKPEGVSILFVSDDPDNEFYATDYFGKIAGAKVKICFNAGDAIEYAKSNRVDVAIADYNIPMANERSEDTTYSAANIQAVLTTAKEAAATSNHSVAFVVFSAWFEKHQEAALKGISGSVQLFRATEPGLFQKCISVIKQTQQKLLEDYDRALAVWRAAQPQKTTEKEPSATKGQTIFVLADSSAEAMALAKFIEQKKGEACTVIPMDSIWYLERELGKNSPNIVIADIIVDDKPEAERIMQLAKAKNPGVKFIFTNEEAAIVETRPKGDNILAVLEKPFHFRNVLSVLSGSYADEAETARKPATSAVSARGALEVLPQEWRDGNLKATEIITELSRLLQIKNVLEQEKSTFIFSEKVTFDNGLGVLLPKIAKSGMKIAVVATNDRQRALIDELNQGKPESERIIYADTITDIRTKIHTARYYYFKVTGDPDTDLQGITTFDITEIVKKIIDALGKVCGIVERERIELLHETARKFAEAA